MLTRTVLWTHTVTKQQLVFIPSPTAHLVHVLEEVVVRLPAQHALRLVGRGEKVHRAAERVWAVGESGARLKTHQAAHA